MMLPILLLVWFGSPFYFLIVLIINFGLINEIINLSRITSSWSNNFFIKFLFFLVSSIVLYLFIVNSIFTVYMLFISIFYFLISLLILRIRKLSLLLINLTLLSCAISIYLFNYDIRILLFLLIVNTVSDVSAYIFGSLIKGPKIFPKISPNKTISGSISAVLLSILVSVYLQFSGNISLNILLGFMISCAGQIGDILASFYKRKIGVKDSGTIIPGHGGFLDRFDSLMLANIFIIIPIYFNLI